MEELEYVGNLMRVGDRGLGTAEWLLRRVLRGCGTHVPSDDTSVSTEVFAEGTSCACQRRALARPATLPFSCPTRYDDLSATSAAAPCAPSCGGSAHRAACQCQHHHDDGAEQAHYENLEWPQVVRGWVDRNANDQTHDDKAHERRRHRGGHSPAAAPAQQRTHGHHESAHAEHQDGDPEEADEER